MSKKETIITVNVDKAIEKFNEKNEATLTREGLINQMETKLTITSLQNWKGGKVPKALFNIAEIMELTGATLEEIITIKKE